MDWCFGKFLYENKISFFVFIIKFRVLRIIDSQNFRLGRDLRDPWLKPTLTDNVICPF